MGSTTELTQNARVKVQSDARMSKHYKYKQISPIFNRVTSDGVSLTNYTAIAFCLHVYIVLIITPKCSSRKKLLDEEFQVKIIPKFQLTPSLPSMQSMCT